MRSNFDIYISKLIIFMLVWYIQMTVTYGTNVPAGLFFGSFMGRSGVCRARGSKAVLP